MVPRTISGVRGMIPRLLIGARNNVGYDIGRRQTGMGMTWPPNRGTGDDIGSTIRDSESRQVF